MRYVRFAAVALGCFVASAPSAMAQKKECPKDATLASRFIWPAGAISPGKTVVGRHSCGRSMQCTGGTSARQGGGRECRWL